MALKLIEIFFTEKFERSFLGKHSKVREKLGENMQCEKFFDD